MNLVLIQQIGTALFQAIQLGVQYGPQLIADLQQLWSLATSGTALTPDQQNQADATLAAAHQTLQAQIAVDAQQDATDTTTA